MIQPNSNQLNYWQSDARGKNYRTIVFIKVNIYFPDRK
jgi:hypothetical protein